MSTIITLGYGYGTPSVIVHDIGEYIFATVTLEEKLVGTVRVEDHIFASVKLEEEVSGTVEIQDTGIQAEISSEDTISGTVTDLPDEE